MPYIKDFRANVSIKELEAIGVDEVFSFDGKYYYLPTNHADSIVPNETQLLNRCKKNPEPFYQLWLYLDSVGLQTFTIRDIKNTLTTKLATKNIIGILIDAGFTFDVIKREWFLENELGYAQSKEKFFPLFAEYLLAEIASQDAESTNNSVSLSVESNNTEEQDSEEEEEPHVSYTASSVCHEEDKQVRVLTTLIHGEEINYKALKSIATFCGVNKAHLHIFFKGQTNRAKIYYSDFPNIESILEGIDYTLHINTDLYIGQKLGVLASANVNHTAIRPLNGVLAISPHKYVVIPHARQELEVSYAQNWVDKTLALSTGCLNNVDAGATRIKAQLAFNSVVGAVVYNPFRSFINLYHINVDRDGGFYDITGHYYRAESKTSNTSGALDTLYLDDPHFSLVDETYFGNLKQHFVSLKPMQMIGGDTFNGSSLLYHEQNRIGFAQNRMSLIDEIEATSNCVKSLLEAANNESKYVMLFANHEAFFEKFLNTPSNIKMFSAQELALIYRTIAHMLDNTYRAYDGIHYGNPLHYLFKSLYETGLVVDEPQQNFDILLNCHGHEFGLSSLATRGTIKATVGHCHAPSIRQGVHKVGALQIEHPTYHAGVSASAQGCDLLWSNGKRTLAVNL